MAKCYVAEGILMVLGETTMPYSTSRRQGTHSLSNLVPSLLMALVSRKHGDSSVGEICLSATVLTCNSCFVWPDVYSYDEDDMVLDSKLPEHLTHFGIDMMTMEKVSFVLMLKFSRNNLHKMCFIVHFSAIANVRPFHFSHWFSIFSIRSRTYR